MPQNFIERVLQSHEMGSGITIPKGQIESLGVWRVRCASCEHDTNGTYDSPSGPGLLYVHKMLENDGWQHSSQGWRCRVCVHQNTKEAAGEAPDGTEAAPVSWGPIDMGNRFNELLETWWRRASAERMTPHARPDYADATERCANELRQAYEEAFSAARRAGLENATRPPEVTRSRATSAASQATAEEA